MLTASDVMTPYPLKVDWDTPVTECARIMSEARCRYLPVVQNGGLLRGIVSDLVVFRGFGPTATRKRLHASDIAVPIDVVVHADEPLLSLIDKVMASSQCVALVVDDDNVLVGIVTSHDLVRIAPTLVDPEAPILAWARGSIHTIDRLRPATAALALMIDRSVRHLVVVSDDMLYGVITLFDLVDAGVVDGQELRVDAAIPSPRIDHATATTSLRSATRMMADWHIGCLPVVGENDRVVAVLGRADIVGALRDALAHHPENWGAEMIPPASANERIHHP